MSEKDLFDDSTMTFGEHLEALRTHLWRAIIGWLIATIAAFYLSEPIIVEMQQPVNRALQKVFVNKAINVTGQEDVDKAAKTGITDWIKGWFSNDKPAETEDPPQPKIDPRLVLTLDGKSLMQQLHDANSAYPEVPEDLPDSKIEISIAKTPLGELIEEMRFESLKPRTDGVDEAFMIYLKVSLVVGFVISSPWIFFQLWLFVAAGLYPTERKHVYRYLPLSIILFLVGVAFCYYFVIPVMLEFLFRFNVNIDVRPEVKIGTWIMFAMVVSLMFGLSFQLPLVMVVLDKIQLVQARVYREQRRWAILIIAFLSMVLTPADPISMLAMMIPLLILYEFGILMCGLGGSKKNPFATVN